MTRDETIARLKWRQKIYDDAANCEDTAAATCAADKMYREAADHDLYRCRSLEVAHAYAEAVKLVDDMIDTPDQAAAPAPATIPPDELELWEAVKRGDIRVIRVTGYWGAYAGQDTAIWVKEFDTYIEAARAAYAALHPAEPKPVEFSQGDTVRRAGADGEFIVVQSNDDASEYLVARDGWLGWCEADELTLLFPHGQARPEAQS